MTKYPTYKDSGIEWLGQIPTHWEMLKAKYMFQKNKLESYMGVDVMHYRVAELNEKEFQAVKKVEAIMEEETGKKYVMIAWEKEKNKKNVNNDNAFADFGDIVEVE